jgi:hypothetical protein
MKKTNIDLELMRQMHKEGYSLREIGRKVGLKGAQSVKFRLERYPNAKSEEVIQLRQDNKKTVSGKSTVADGKYEALKCN